ncbi:MAG TPA: hypothetical protein VF600_18980 [Abditibacteriaceae bacterium]|jgi:hypothetical protein
MMQEALKEQDTQHPTDASEADTPTTDVSANEAAHPATPASPENQQTRTARLFLEDFVVTALLRTGRALSPSELSQSAEGFSLSRARLRDGLEGSRRIVAQERNWELALRAEYSNRPRSERTRRPLEGTLEELLQAMGKPLPLPVVVRELSMMRSVIPDAVRDAAAHILRTARTTIEVAPGAWIHQSFTLDAGAPSELIVRENQLDADPDWQELQGREFPQTGGTLAERAAAVLQAAGRPLSQRVLGFFLWRQNPAEFNERALAVALGDRAVFYPFVGGVVTTQAQMPQWRAQAQAWLQSYDDASASNLDVVALLRTRLPANALVTPRPEDIEEIRKMAAVNNGQPVSLANVMTDALELEPDDPQFVPILQGLNDALRRDPEWLPAGAGRFLLREAVPSYVGNVPDILRPVHLSIRDTETDEPLDIEMSDDGLEGDCVDFIHAPEWEDVNEEVEVKMARRPAGQAAPTSVRYVLLYPHYRAGTMKLRRVDEDFFVTEGPLTRIGVRAEDAEGTQNIGAWTSRESGLIYGLGEWFTPRAPQSGGVLEFTREPSGQVRLALGAPDKLMHIEDNRVEELEALQERSDYLALFDLLQQIMSEQQQGAELPTLWAEVNVVRRTTKRLLCSVLSAYHCFYFKQRGPKQILWRFDAGKLDQGFKRNKRKYVRR